MFSLATATALLTVMGFNGHLKGEQPKSFQEDLKN